MPHAAQDSSMLPDALRRVGIDALFGLARPTISVTLKAATITPNLRRCPHEVVTNTDCPSFQRRRWEEVGACDQPRVSVSAERGALYCPNVESSASGNVAKYYGVLRGEWREELRQGFAECFRVLRPGGTLIFKWNELDVPLREILALTPEKPLYGHKSGKLSKTHWVAFLKPNQ